MKYFIRIINIVLSVVTLSISKLFDCYTSFIEIKVNGNESE